MNTTPTEIRVVDAGNIRDLFNDILKEFSPDYRYLSHYSTCENFDRDPTRSTFGEPRCIVGQVLHRLDIRADDCMNAGALAPTITELRESRPDIVFTAEAILMLAAAQGAQDSGATWGAAVAAADVVKYTIRDLDLNIGTPNSNPNHKLWINEADPTIQIKGIITNERFVGGSHIITIDVDGTTSSIDLDRADWRELNI